MKVKRDCKQNDSLGEEERAVKGQWIWWNMLYSFLKELQNNPLFYKINVIRKIKFNYLHFKKKEKTESEARCPGVEPSDRL